MLSRGRLSAHFAGFAAKRLSEVEINTEKSNQHEFNATKDVLKVFGREKRSFNTSFYYLAEEEERVVSTSGTLTLYDAREKNPQRTEFRLYYPSNPVLEEARPEDLMLLCLRKNGNVLCIISPRGSTGESQLMWLFGLSEIRRQFVANQLTIGTREDLEIGYAAGYILEELGIEVPAKAQDKEELDHLLRKFGFTFPKTKEFSAYSRAGIPSLEEIDDPDAVLIACMEKEESLFRALENHIVKVRLKEGFGREEDMVENFVQFSLSVQNRRKSRAGYAFQNHLEYIFQKNNIYYSAQAYTEGRKKPDFLFPEAVHYKNPAFPEKDLTMLAVKTSCKERWAQIISEADRILPKHLATLEPAMPKLQTEEISRNKIQLVVPAEIRKTYSPEQQKTILSLSEFIELVRSRQKRYYIV